MMKPNFDDYDAVIFDLDGTLVDSMWVWEEVDVEYLGNYGLDVPEDLHRSLDGLSIIETAEYFQKRFDIPEDTETMIANWNRLAMQLYAHRVPLKKGTARLLHKLTLADKQIGIASSNSKELIEAVLDAHDITRFFGCVFSGSEIAASKPAPDIYLAAARALHVSPERCLVFEDIEQGIQAGIAAGMRVCGVADSYSEDREEEKKALSHFFIDDFDELFDDAGEFVR